MEELEDSAKNVVATGSPSQSVSSDTDKDDSCVKLDEERGHWSHPAEFVLSLLGYCVGIGNVWRFPYVCIQNGGGTFLIPFFIFLFLCGMPIFFLELVIGQFSNLSPATIWAACPLFRGVGLGMCLVSGVCSIYYNVIMAWSLLFIIKSLTFEALPWSHCNNTWNTANCVDMGNRTMSAATNITFNRNASYTQEMRESAPVSPAREFWERYILNFSDDSLQDYVTIHWPLFFLLMVCWLAICLTIINGIKTSGKVVYFTATVPFLMLFCLFVKSLTLPGASLGLTQLGTVDWYRLVTDINVWMSACLQVFYSLGPAWGSLITLSSFNKFNFNCYRTAILASCTDCLACVIAGVVTYAVLGSMATKLGTDIGSVAAGGPGLAFIVYPEIVCQFPMPQLWSVMFFTMLITLGIDTQFGTMETLVTGAFDYFPNLRKRHKTFTCLICAVWFVLGIPLITKSGLHLFSIIDYYMAAPSVILLALMECVALAFVYGADRLVDDITLMLGKTPWPIWKWMWKTITPLLLTCIVIFTCVTMREPKMFKADGQITDYPTWLIVIGWLSGLVSIVPIPALMVWEFCFVAEGSFNARWRSSTKSRPEWAPASTAAVRAAYSLKYNETGDKNTEIREEDQQAHEEIPFIRNDDL